ncbi:flagellar biosynthetic protein FliO [Bradyrhizobium sp. LHD-71]|uniref:flagellar biosynthetic protein FliO n=1 Tax=Bradyrhizobium sp. LHD-71 TaxID=3072141 RepID=UPI00280ECB0A|nr:flagellar biosynthetic protein FliO [Bradyrhizobium sp. LHD-71]MDQ8732746.1 flagellar biosynthetic protein FliO [Bradyrhizobium sp. LHD-71]
MQSAAGFFFAFIVVLALIGLATWLVRRFAGNRMGSGPNRGRMPRLAVVDAAAVDGRRRLVLVRRDNIEHLLMIGGPSDIVIEPNIIRATPAQQQLTPRAPLPPVAEQPWTDSEPPRPEPLEHDEPMPLPEPPARPTRPAFAEEMRRSPGPERRPDPLAGFSPEPMVRPEPALREPPRVMPRPEPAPPPPRPARPEPQKAAPPIRTAERPAAPPPSQVSAADKNLAEMAQRLEAALRRPGANPRANANEQISIDRVGAPPVAPEGPGRATPPRAPTSEPAATDAPENEKPPADAPRSQFKNLEDEMASLLGRPKTPS